MSQSPPSDSSKQNNELTKYVEEIDRILGDQRTKVPAQKKRELATLLFASFSGPLPPPEFLQRYEDIVPGCAKQIMDTFVAQSNHRMALEKLAIGSQLEQSNRGQYFGLIVALAGLGSAVYLGATGHDWLAGTIGGVTLVSMVTAFIVGKSEQRSNLKKKDPK